MRERLLSVRTRAGTVVRGDIPTTADRILDVAEQLVQTQGFNGFSYADIAEALRIKKASLHYHFPTKAALGQHLVARYHERFFAALGAIEAGVASPAERLRRYVGLYERVLRDGRMCLCGMLAAEHATLPVAMRNAIRRFFEANEQWLAAQLQAGRTAGELDPRGSSVETARTLLGSLEGSMLLARASGRTARFGVIARRLVSDLVAPRGRAASPGGRRGPAASAKRRAPS